MRRYFKTVPIEVSDEEYAEILKYQKNSKRGAKNAVSVVFKVMAWIIFIGGFLAGIVLATALEYDVGGGFSFAIALAYWVMALVSGMAFFGFGEIIQLLTDIRNEQK